MPAWYEDGKLGIFIHWGLPSVPGFASGEIFQDGEMEEMITRGEFPEELPYSEWYYYAMQNENGPTRRWHEEQYGADAPYDIFKPMFEENVGNWDPEAWAKLFAATGAHYVVLVTKHHDGYTLWPSDVENPNKKNWGSERDLVAELADAVRAKGMKFGAYYSGGFDWTFHMPINKNAFTRFLSNGAWSQEYADYANAHVRELIDRYKPDLIWSDGGYPSKGGLYELLDYYYNSVPEGVINDRWTGFDKISRIASLPGLGWLTRKMFIRMFDRKDSESGKDEPRHFGFQTAEYANLPYIVPHKWESTRGIGASFAYNRKETEQDMLTGIELIDFLVDTVSKNGNVLINVGPDSHGQIPAMQQKPLLEMGDWLKVNGKAIYGTRPWSNFGGDTEFGGKLRYTQDDSYVYAVVLGDHNGEVILKSLDIKPSAIELLGAGAVPFQLDGDMVVVQLEPVANGRVPAQVLQIPKSS